MAKVNFLGGKLEAFDDTNNKLAGGKAYFYEPGTSTPKDTYTTSALTTANANPVILDSAGRAAIWLANADYDMKLTDSADVTVYTASNINPAATASASNYNLQENGSFEDDTDADGQPDKWAVTVWGTQTLDTTFSTHGAQSIKFTSTGSGGGYVTSEDFLPVSETRRYSLHFSMKSSVADVRNLVQILWYDSAQTSVSTEVLLDDSATNPTSETEKFYFIKPPATARYCKLEFYGCHSSDTTAGSTWYDDVIFQNQTAIFNGLTKGADMAVATTMTLAGDGNYIDATGTGTMSAISGDQDEVTFQFDAAATIAAAISPTGANVTTVAGDHFHFVQPVSGTWYCDYYTTSDGRVLAAPTAAQGSSRVLLETLTISSDASKQASAGTWTDYSCLIAVIENLYPASTSSLQLTFNGTSSAYAHSSQHWQEASSSSSYSGSGSASVIDTSAFAFNSSSTNTINGEIKFFNLTNSTYPAATWHITGNDASGRVANSVGSGNLENTTAVTTIEFFMSTGNMTSGTIYIYGIKNA